MVERHGPDVVAQKLETDRGKLNVWLPAPAIVAHQFIGHFDLELARALLSVLDRIHGRRGSILLFCDWEGMRTYDSDARMLLTQWVRSHKADILGIHVLVRDKLVGMGVSVANLALGGVISSYTDRNAWDVALQEKSEQVGRGAPRETTSVWPPPEPRGRR